MQPKTWERTDEDKSENAASVATLFTFGSFRMLDMGDLTWNREMQLMCPNNPIGTVDLWLVNHHGSDLSNNPALVNAVGARVAVMNNGARKGGSASVVALMKAAPGLQGFYMLHRSVSAADGNPPDAFIANLDRGVGRQLDEDLRREERHDGRHQRPDRGIQDLQEVAECPCVPWLSVSSGR